MPPHLVPNPIAGSFSHPSVLQKICAAMLAWFLFVGSGIAMILIGSRAEARLQKQVEPRTVTVLFERAEEASLAPPPPPVPGAAAGATRSEIPTEGPSASFDPRALAHPELAEAPPPPSLDFPEEINLLPTRPVIYSGGSAGTPGVLGSGSGTGEGSGAGTRWGSSPLLSGEARGVTVTLDSLDVLHQEVPAYPPAARSAKISGEVLVDVVIDDRGKPIEVKIVRSDHILLNPPVLEVARKWRFTPILFGGQRMRANFRICFRFILETN